MRKTFLVMLTLLAVASAWAGLVAMTTASTPPGIAARSA